MNVDNGGLIVFLVDFFIGFWLIIFFIGLGLIIGLVDLFVLVFFKMFFNIVFDGGFLFCGIVFGGIVLFFFLNIFLNCFLFIFKVLLKLLERFKLVVLLFVKGVDIEGIEVFRVSIIVDVCLVIIIVLSIIVF